MQVTCLFTYRRVNATNMRSRPAQRPKTGRVYFLKENRGCWVRGGWVGPKDDCLLASLRLDPFCDTTYTLFTPNLTVEDR